MRLFFLFKNKPEHKQTKQNKKNLKIIIKYLDVFYVCLYVFNHEIQVAWFTKKSEIMARQQKHSIYAFILMNIC